MEEFNQKKKNNETIANYNYNYEGIDENKKTEEYHNALNRTLSKQSINEFIQLKEKNNAILANIKEKHVLPPKQNKEQKMAINRIAARTRIKDKKTKANGVTSAYKKALENAKEIARKQKQMHNAEFLEAIRISHNGIINSYRKMTNPNQVWKKKYENILEKRKKEEERKMEGKEKINTNKSFNINEIIPKLETEYYNNLVSMNINIEDLFNLLYCIKILECIQKFTPTIKSSDLNYLPENIRNLINYA
jgi:hypothetical protein